MALVLNEEQVMLKESAAGFLAQKASVAQLRALRDSRDERGFSAAVWQDMAEMGWAGIAIPEAFGGLGYGYTGLGLVLEQAGRNLSASPLQSTVLVAATVIGFYAGYALDRFFGTSPWLMLVFLLLGIAAGFKNLFDQVKKIQDFDDSTKGQKGAGRTSLSRRRAPS